MLSFFFFNDTATTEISPLSLHDALPICSHCLNKGFRHGRHWAFQGHMEVTAASVAAWCTEGHDELDRKSTRLNSSHGYISYAVFCLKKKTIASRPSCKRSPSRERPRKLT